jgi:hypothetical protein
MLYNYNRFILAVDLDGQVQMNTDSGTLFFVDHSVIAHGSHEGNLIDFAIDSVTDAIYGFVPVGGEIIC